MSFVLDVRHQVAAFALLMEKQLRANDGKGGWEEEPTGFLLKRLKEEVRELVRANPERARQGKPGDTGDDLHHRRNAVAVEAADVANYCLMLADVCHRLIKPKQEIAPNAGKYLSTREILDETSRVAREAIESFKRDTSGKFFTREDLLQKEAEIRVEAIANQPPIPMRLICPDCGVLHIDEGEFATKVHTSHSCQACGMTWRPAVAATVGVRFLPGFRNGSPEATKTP